MLQNLTELKHTLAPVFASYDISRAVLFGSLAAGTATETSDLDLMVESRLRGLRFVGFMEAVHIFDVSHIEKGSRLEREIQTSGVTIYEK